MSMFHKPYTVCSISSPSDFMGVAPDRNENNLILTLKNNMIVIRNIETQVSMKSWMTQDRLTSKVIYDVTLKQYVGVFAKRFIRLWNENCDNLNECEKYSFKRNIDNIVTVGNDTFVIFSNGTCNLLTEAIKTRKVNDEINYDDNMLAGNGMIKANITKFSNNRLMLTYFEEDAHLTHLSLVCMPLYKHDTTPRRFNITRAKIYAKLVSYIVYEGEDSPMLCTVWTDQRVFVMPLTDDTESDMSPGKYMTILTDLNLALPVSLTIVATNILAIYGKRASKNGAILLLFDLNYKVIIVRHYYEQYLSDTCLYVANHHIYLAMGQNLMATMYKLGKSPLADAIGKQHDHILDSRIIMNSIDEEELNNEGLKPIDAHDVQEIFVEEPISNMINNNKMDVKPADGQTIPYENVDGFNKKLEALLQQHFEIELLQSKDTKLSMEIELMENVKDTGFHNKQLCYIIAAMENAGASQCEITDRLYAVLIKADQLAEIGNVLRHYTYISSLSLAKVLRYLLQKLKEHDISDVIKEQAIDKKISIEEVLDILLACEFDAKVLQLYIRNEINEVLLRLLLQYLYDSITSKKDNNNYVQRPTNNVASMHAELQIFRWFGLLLQSYYHRIVLFKDQKFIDLLLRWRNVFQSYKHEVAELEHTADRLYKLIQKHKLVKHKVLYSIQRINF